MSKKDGYTQLNAQVPDEEYNKFQVNSRKDGRDVTKNINYMIVEYNKTFPEPEVATKKKTKKSLKKNLKK